MLINGHSCQYLVKSSQLTLNQAQWKQQLLALTTETPILSISKWLGLVGNKFWADVVKLFTKHWWPLVYCKRSAKHVQCYSKTKKTNGVKHVSDDNCLESHHGNRFSILQPFKSNYACMTLINKEAHQLAGLGKTRCLSTWNSLQGFSVISCHWLCVKPVTRRYAVFNHILQLIGSSYWRNIWYGCRLGWHGCKCKIWWF